MEYVVNRLALRQIFLHKNKRKILPQETELSTPLIPNKSLDILSAVLEFLNVDRQTNTWRS
jgi:hypothetical protein